MYKVYRLKIKPISSFITPLQSDTIFGHLLWKISERHGEKRSSEIVEESMNERPPFIPSDGFLEGVFPKINKRLNYELLEISTPDDYARFKKLKKEKFTNIADFNYLRDSHTMYEYYRKKSSEESTIMPTYKVEDMPHNNINRLSGTTEDGGIYKLSEIFYDSNIDIFFKVRMDYNIEELTVALKDLERSGYGKKASSGKGSFKILDFSEYKEFKEIENPNAFILLSSYIPKDGDFTGVVTSEVRTKFGKLGGDLGGIEVLFKKPFISYQAGSLFTGEYSHIKGKILENIHLDKKIIQFGIPFILEVKI